jgi:hypothetical protein
MFSNRPRTSDLENVAPGFFAFSAGAVVAVFTALALAREQRFRFHTTFVKADLSDTTASYHK